jgi:hypothetical protein
MKYTDCHNSEKKFRSLTGLSTVKDGVVITVKRVFNWNINIVPVERALKMP